MTETATLRSGYAQYPQMPYASHLLNLRWRQGEHILVCGPTSAGKTTLIRPTLEKRSHVVALFTKLKDDTIKREFVGWKRYDRWPRNGLRSDETRVMFWPYPEKTTAATIAKHRDVMHEVIDNILREGNRCLYMDEGLYLADPKYGGCEKEIGLIHYAGRSHGISAVTTAQRPYYLPRIVLSSITHAYFARTRDKDDLKRLSDLGSVDAKEVSANLDALTDRHDFVYLNPQGDSEPAIVNAAR